MFVSGVNIKTKPATFKELPISLRPNLLGRQRPPRSALRAAAPTPLSAQRGRVPGLGRLAPRPDASVSLTLAPAS